MGVALAGAATTASMAQQPVPRVLTESTSRAPARVSAVRDARSQGYRGQAMSAQASIAPPPAPYLTLDTVSPYFQEPIVPKKLKVHDVVTVVVKENSAYLSEGSVDRRKNGLYEAVLKDWVKLASGLTLKPAEQSDGDPKASGTIQQTYRADSELELRNRIEFRIAATVVDIRPNGNLVLEAHNTFQQDNEVVDASLTGIIRPDDVLPDNTVLSEDVVELKVQKKTKGHVRDGYRRGWMTKVIDTINPF
jgi:flagellar L-ring protein precursor FlgH